jgi:hypothetical protein
MIASVTFIAILMTILIQAPTLNGWGASSGCWRNAESVDRGNRVAAMIPICES